MLLLTHILRLSFLFFIYVCVCKYFKLFSLSVTVMFIMAKFSLLFLVEFLCY